MSRIDAGSCRVAGVLHRNEVYLNTCAPVCFPLALCTPLLRVGWSSVVRT